MGEKIPRWEAELWSYLSSGDGVHCPVYSHCQLRLGGGWCISDHKEHIKLLLDVGQFSLSKHNFVQTPGRIFELVEMLAQKYVKWEGFTPLRCQQSLLDWLTRGVL